MRYVFVLLLAVSILVSVGCENTMLSGALNRSSFAGTVSIVRLSVSNNGTQFTFVTLLNTMSSQDFNFCGNVVSQFPMNTPVQGSFTPGNTCGTIVSVSVMGGATAPTMGTPMGTTAPAPMPSPPPMGTAMGTPTPPPTPMP